MAVLLTLQMIAPLGRSDTTPNIVIIYGADVGYGDLGRYGANTIPTPNFNRLAAGVR